MRRTGATLFWLAIGTAATLAEPACRNPPPIFHCEDWRQDEHGQLVSIRRIKAGLIEMGQNGYLGDHTIIDGLDYTEALKQQCRGTWTKLSPPVARLFAVAAGADPLPCKNPPPVFDCADWEVEDGVLVAKRTMTVGLMRIDEGSYIGGHILIDGLDYGDLLRRQCSRPGEISDEPHP